MPDYSSFPVSDGVRTYLEAPKGYGVNFDNPQTQFHAALYAVFSIGNLLALLFLSQQLYTKLVLSKGLQIEDVIWGLKMPRAPKIGVFGLFSVGVM
ncbi:hypothetical protein ACO1O0_004818 [Amphichorda felina]